MKPLLDALFGSLKWLIAVMVSLVSGWIWIETHFDSKVQASENRTIEKVQLMREADMAVILSIKEDTLLIKREMLRRQK